MKLTHTLIAAAFCLSAVCPLIADDNDNEKEKASDVGYTRTSPELRSILCGKPGHPPGATCFSVACIDLEWEQAAARSCRSAARPKPCSFVAGSKQPL